MNQLQYIFIYFDYFCLYVYIYICLYIVLPTIHLLVLQSAFEKTACDGL